MTKVAEMRVSVHHEAGRLIVVLEGDELDSVTLYPRKVSFDVATELIKTLRPTMIVALSKLLRIALDASRPPPPREEP